MSFRIYHEEDIVFISLGDNVSFSAFIIPSKALQVTSNPLQMAKNKSQFGIFLYLVSVRTEQEKILHLWLCFDCIDQFDCVLCTSLNCSFGFLGQSTVVNFCILFSVFWPHSFTAHALQSLVFILAASTSPPLSTHTLTQTHTHIHSLTLTAIVKLDPCWHLAIIPNILEKGDVLQWDCSGQWREYFVASIPAPLPCSFGLACAREIAPFSATGFLLLGLTG